MVPSDDTNICSHAPTTGSRAGSTSAEARSDSGLVPGETMVLVPPEPPVDRLTGHVEAVRHLDDRHSIADDREHCLVPLFHDTQLHQHERECVTDQAEPL